jgi:tRNA A-37 threonylcarbamoyl transferase component Bud32
MVVVPVTHKPEGRPTDRGGRVKQRVRQGLAHWPDLARQAGLPVTGWTPRLLSSRQDVRGDRTVILLRHDLCPPVVCKQTFRPAEAAAMALGLTAQDRAAQALAAHPDAGVPAVMARLTDQGAVLMQAVEGPTLLSVVAGCGVTPATCAALRRAGQWLDAFHRSGPVETRAFQPRFMADHFAAVAAEVRAGTRRVPRKDRFLTHVAALLSRVEAAKGAATLSAVQHGDLTARNLILSPQRVWGFDMAGADTRPAGYDIARLLVYTVEQMQVPPTPEVVPPPLMAAFRDGYRFTAADDAAVRFLIAARLISDWLTMPETRSAMTILQFMRFRRLTDMAAAALA